MRIAPRLIPLLPVCLGAARDTAQRSISVNVDPVILQATVRERSGAPAPDLSAEDFSVFEDGVRRTIRVFRHDDAPVTVGLVVDHSGSMRPKLSAAVAAARTFVRFSSPEDEMFAVNFNENVTLGLPGSRRFTNRPGELSAAVEKTGAAGTTALHDALMEGLRQLRNGSREKALVLISDGAGNAGKYELTQVLDLAMEWNAAIYTIGVFEETDPDRNPRVLRRMADVTGGEAFIPNPTHGISVICQRIASSIRQQNIVGYVSQNPAPRGRFRKIRLTERSGQRTIRTRSAYIAKGTP